MATRFCDQCGVSVAAVPPGAGSWEVGRDTGCSVVIDEPQISLRHCRLTAHPDGLWIEDLGSTNGTFVNGVRVTSPIRLRPEDRVTLGQGTPLTWRPDGAVRPVPLRPEAPAPRRLAEREITIGRDSGNDVVLDYPMVSERHARIRFEEGQTLLEDLGSRNGTALGGPEHKIGGPTLLPEGATVYFGSLPVPASRLLTPGLALGEAPHTTLRLAVRPMALGRDPASELVLDYPMVSWHHARLIRTGSGLTLEDLRSTNGTFVNGRRIAGRQRVQVGDVIGLGSCTLRLTAPDRLEKRDYRGNVTVEARGVSVDVPGRRLIEDVSLVLYPSELVGLMGPSGSGKSTLLNAINGYSAPAAGQVFFNRHDLYGHYDQFRRFIGYVPQDDIIHRTLTVREALYFSARLRLPDDFTDHQINDRIDQVLGHLGLEGTGDTLVGSPVKRGISGGQRKRVNLAMELISDPFVLLLDEPTSGLSSEDALAVMRVLRQLADRGKTILISIHQPSRAVFEIMDSVAVLAKDAGSQRPARLVYFGAAFPDSIQFFNPGIDDPEPSPDLLLQGLAKRSTNEWAARWGSSRQRLEYVEQRVGTTPAGAAAAAPAAKSRRSPGFGQWSTLVRRCLALKVRDEWNTGILIAQAPVIALLIVLVFGRGGTAAPVKAIFLMVVAALWFGASNSAREIVGEWAIYHRERMINLKLPSYLASKLTVLGAISLVQCMLLLAIVHGGCGLDGPWFPMLALLVLTAVTGIATGLVVSSLARSSEMAISLVPLVLLPMVILGGMLQPVHEMAPPMRAAAGVTPSRWAFEGLLILESDRREEAPAVPIDDQLATETFRLELADPFFPREDRSSLFVNTFVQCLLLAILVAAALAILRRRDAH